MSGQLKDRPAGQILVNGDQPAVLSTEELRAHITELKGTEVERHEFPNLNAVHFIFKGLLGTGGSSSLRVDRLGKAAGEYLRTIPVPAPRTPGL